LIFIGFYHKSFIKIEGHMLGAMDVDED